MLRFYKGELLKPCEMFGNKCLGFLPNDFYAAQMIFNDFFRQVFIQVSAKVIIWKIGGKTVAN